MTRPSWIGYTLGGRYQIESLLGQGGMSAVYRAHDPNLRRAVAVKLIHSHLSNDQDFVRRFESEAAAIAQLRHPNIVQVYDFDHDGETYYMVMEFLPGESLQGRLKALHTEGRRLPVAEAAALMATMADAVAYAHVRGMIHRDLKPANVMLMADGQPVLTDFGVAKILGSQQHTATGAILGTPMYMSPEQVQGLPQDARTDIYSMGIMLFEMATGHPPYEGDSAITIMLKHVNEPLPDIRARGVEVPAALKELVDRALAKQAAERFQSAAEMATALRLIAQQTPVPPPPPVVPVNPPEVLQTKLEAPTGLMSRPVIEQTSPMIKPAAPPPARPPQPPTQPPIQAPPPELPPARPREAQPPPRPARQQSGTIVVSPESLPEPERRRERPAREREAVQPLAPAAPPKRSSLGLILAVSGILLFCLVVGGVMAVLGGPTLLDALLGAATQPATEAVATPTSELGGQTLVPPTEPPTEVVVPTEPPTEAPTEIPTDTPTPEPTEVPVPEGMVLIPGGSFAMGSGSGDSAPVHQVTLDAYYLDQFEVTNARYQACVSAGACSAPVSNNSFTRSGYFTNASFSQYPVVNVTWNQAEAFCLAEGKRLPTEAEWEFAAGSGRSLPYPWGGTFDAGRTTVTQGDTVQVGSFSNGASEQGVNDLAGNALEWVADWYQSDYYTESPDTNPPGPNAGSQKVLRGGSFGNPDPAAYLSTRRYRRAPGGTDVDIGFRCATSVP